VRIEALLEPYYVLRPDQALRSGWERFAKPRTKLVRLAWGLPIAVDTRETVGQAIARNGLFDLAVSELLFRLLEPGERALDAGANIGAMSSAMAVATGPKGKVLAFEPHPDVYGRLRENVHRWSCAGWTSPIETRPIALSDRDGVARMLEPSHFSENQGASLIVPDDGPAHSPGRTITITASRLETEIPATEAPALLKLDVQGHEASVLRGMASILERGDVRDVIFEDEDYPSEAATMLADAHYGILGIGHTFSGVRLFEPGQPGGRHAESDQSYLASRDVARALARTTRPGWRCLRPLRGLGAA
jgi:FkbM family methyltransferase